MVKKISYFPPHLSIVEIQVELGFATSSSFTATQQETVDHFLQDEEDHYHYIVTQFNNSGSDGWNTNNED